MNKLSLKMIQLILMLLAASESSFAQAQMSFFRNFTNGPDTIYAFQAVVKPHGGGYVAAGYKVFNDSKNYFGRGLVIKTDDQGNKLWEREYGYLNKKDIEFYDIKAVGAEHFILCGLVSEDIQGLSAYDFLVTEIDHQGNIVWQNSYGTTGAKEWAWEIQQDVNGGYYVAGWSNTTGGPNSRDMMLIKTDASGNLAWRNDYGTTLGEEAAYATTVTNNGAVLLGGSSTQPPGFSIEGYLIKTDQNGDTLWKNLYPNTVVVRNIVAHQDGNISFCGHGLSPYPTAYLALCDSTGAIIWKKDFQDTVTTAAYAHVRTFDRGYAVAGMNGNGDFRIVRTDSLGNQLWSKYYDFQFDYGYDILQAEDGGFVVCGESASNTPGINYISAILFKTDSLGNLTIPAPTSVREMLTDESMELFPNPAKDKLYIVSKNNDQIRFVVLTDMQGKVITEYNMPGKELNLTNVAPGVYMLKITFSDGRKAAKKIQVE